jgi:AraC family ethanolamine operon transcriptional activator
MAYFRAVRLNAVRQELKTAKDAATVHEVAQSWGFWHGGEFAAAYRRLFGELPSQTLKGYPRGRFTDADAKRSFAEWVPRTEFGNHEK